MGRRDALTDPVEIAAQARFEQTLNHPVVVYRASMVDAAGGYQDLPSMEDYLLFAQLIQAGARVANVAEPLLRYRVSAGAFHRRGGVTLLRSEIEVQRRFLAMGFTTPVQAGHMSIATALTDIRCAGVSVSNKLTAATSFLSGTKSSTRERSMSVRMLA